VAKADMARIINARNSQPQIANGQQPKKKTPKNWRSFNNAFIMPALHLHLHIKTVDGKHGFIKVNSVTSRGDVVNFDVKMEM
jgi:hypothetical protein